MGYVIIQGVIAIQCLTVGVFFLIEKKHQKYNLYLAVYLLLKALFSAINLYSFLYRSLTFAPLNHVISSFFGPVLLLFTLHQLKGQPSLKRRFLWLSLIPATYIITGYLTFFEKSKQLYQIDLPIDISLTFFLVFGILYINRYIAADTKISLLRVRWLRFIFYISLFQVWSYYAHILFLELDLIPTNQVFIWFYMVLNLVLVNGLMLLVMKYPELATGISALKERMKSYPEEKYQYSSLEAGEAKSIIRETRRLVEDEAGYRNPELSLSEVASATGYEAKLISQAINQYLKLNFKQYLNKVRLEAAQHMLTHEDHADMRINEIMYATGFNSKSSFSTLFKSKTGCTPNEYRKKGKHSLV